MGKNKIALAAARWINLRRDFFPFNTPYTSTETLTSESTPIKGSDGPNKARAVSYH